MIADENQIEVRQNAGDEASPLTCSPECPQVKSAFCSLIDFIDWVSLVDSLDLSLVVFL